MIASSAVFTVVAVGLLIAGIITGNLPIMIGAVVVSLAASGCLVAAIRQRRGDAPAASVEEAVGEATAMPFPPMAPTQSTDPFGQSPSGR